MLAALKEQILNPNPLTMARVPIAEKESRLEMQKRRLSGVLIESHAEPSHALLDITCQIWESNLVRYIPLEKCFSRMVELANMPSKSQPKILELESSKIVVKDKELDMESNVSSSYQVLEALKRRGLELDFASVMSFRSHERYVQTLFNHLNREPPPGYVRASVSQIVAADKAAWMKIIELNIKPRANAAGELPLDTELIKALESYEVSFALLLCPRSQPHPMPHRSRPLHRNRDQTNRSKHRKAKVQASIGSLPMAKERESPGTSSASLSRSGMPVERRPRHRETRFVSITR